MGKTPEEILELVVYAADQQQAKDLIAIDMKGISVMSDYNVISHGSNSRLVNAIAEAVVGAAQKAGITPKSIEGKQGGNWILVDLGDVIFHVFDEEERGHYNLEGLWAEAPSVDLSEWVTD